MVVTKDSVSSPDSATPASGHMTADAGAIIDAAPHTPAPGACALDDDAGTRDSDGDGALDACDLDDDGDGFPDVDDPAPKDPLVPGDFSTPEAILNNPIVKKALVAATAAGFPVPTELGRNPPDLSGLRVVDELKGHFVATDDKTSLNSTLVGSEKRTEVHGESIATYSVDYAAGKAISYAISSGSLLRGDGDRYTVYSRGKSKCTESSSDHATYRIGISSGILDPTSGDTTNIISLSVTIADTGKLTAACADRGAGTTELPGGWSVYTLDVSRHTTVDQLHYMCVDGGHAYVPTETWSGAAGTACSCGVDYKVHCAPAP